MDQNNKKTLKMLSNTIDFPLIEWYTLYCQEGDRKTMTGQAGRGGNMEEMTRLELMTLLLSLEALLEDGKAEKALEVIRKVLAEAEKA